MGGQRHSKNAGTMGVEGLTYHEKKALGFGTVQQRLGKVQLLLLPLFLEHFVLLLVAVGACISCTHSSYLQDSVGNYYDCRLTLQPAVVSYIVCCWLEHGLLV